MMLIALAALAETIDASATEAAAQAASVITPLSGFQGNLFTWGSINTFSGAVALVVLIVQLGKGLVDRLIKIRTQYLAYAVSLGVLLLAQYYTNGKLSTSDILLAAINATMVALGAMTLYDKVFRGGEKNESGLHNQKQSSPP